jgi:cytochrome oxidase assembly protein ShyY1
MGMLNAPMGAPTAGRRLWPRWVALALVVVGLVVAFVNLGQWQLARLEQRRERNEAVAGHENAPVVDYRQVFGRQIVEADQWQRVTVTGNYDAGHQFVAAYRANGGASSGYEVVTPLLTTAGDHLLVSRGWAERPTDAGFPATAAPPPAGTVTVVGYVRRDEQGSGTVPEEGQIRLINATDLAPALPYPVLDGYLGALETTPADASGLVPVHPPELTEGNHFSYALQWFAFSAMAAVGLVVLVRSDLRQRGRVPATGGTVEGEEDQ